MNIVNFLYCCSPLLVSITIQLFCSFMLPSYYALGTFISAIVFLFWNYFHTKSTGQVSNYLFQDNKLLTAIFFILLGFSLQIFSVIFIRLFFLFFPFIEKAYTTNMASLISAPAIIVILNILILGPVSEELIFRRILINNFKLHVNDSLANILQSLLFAIYHLNFVQFIYSLILGLFLGRIIKKTNSIILCILTHFSFNLFSFFINLKYLSLGMLFICSLIILLLAFKVLRDEKINIPKHNLTNERLQK